MNLRQKLTPDETRMRILEVAEAYFRRVGYTKTTIADLAVELGMSSANVYRYFPSKGAINEAICRRLLAESHELIEEIAGRLVPASERLRTMILELHSFNKSRYTGERRMHEMVAVAMEENWAVVQEHLEFLIRLIARLIDEGARTGEFRNFADHLSVAGTVKQACSCLLHPMMIAERARTGMDSKDDTERLVAFVINGLKA